MKHFGLKLRMAIVGSILFAFYAIAGLVLVAMYGDGIIPLVIIGSIGLVGVQYKVGKWAALRSVGAEDIDETRSPEIHRMVDRLCEDMDLKKPRVMRAQMGMPNAFAVGRRGAGIVVISDELMRLLDRDELEGVIAHELAHIDNRDVVIMVLGQGIASIVGIVAQFIVLRNNRGMGGFFQALIVGQLMHFLVMLFVLAISRYREYVADADAKQAIGTGEPLARALEKISSQPVDPKQTRIDENVNALCIFGLDQGLIGKLLSSHPATEKRIERLRA